MNKLLTGQNVLITALTAVVVGGVLVYFVTATGSDADVPAGSGSGNGNRMEKTNGGGSGGNDTKLMDAERKPYVEYSQEAFENARNERRVLFFFAPWCSTCTPADAEFESNKDKIPSDVVLFRANYDTEKALKAKYGITYQHTFVLVDADGNAITRWNGGAVSELLKNIK